MPIMPCQKEGKSGFKWGESGTCYTGPDAKALAAEQAAAIKSAQQNDARIATCYNPNDFMDAK